MKKVIYRLQFRFDDTGSIDKKRDIRLASLFSGLEDIDTENPIIIPSKGTVIEIDSQDYIVMGTKTSFLIEGDTVFYITIVILGVKEPVRRFDNDEYLKDMINKYLNEGGDSWVGTSKKKNKI